jgi:glycosyltransferase involved in cell wall biosynthesis
LVVIMNIMINLLPLKTGGGVQVALDFLRQAAIYGSAHNWMIVSRQNSSFKDLSHPENIRHCHEVPDNLFSRLKFEYSGCKLLIDKYQVDVVYTQFGPHWPGSNVSNIAGCAYSNLFYPDLDFWGNLSVPRRALKKMIDKLRLKRILAADVRIFETEDLANRATHQHKLDPKTVTFVRPAVSSLVDENASHEETAERCKSLPDGYKVLLLSGYHPNKNIELLVDTARSLQKMGCDNVKFVLTLPADNPGTLRIIAKAKELGVSSYIYNFGPVHQQGCCELYRACNAAVLPSTLESFSNMIAESWSMKVPLLISNLSWCRSLCGQGALYFDFLNCESLANQLVALRADENLQQSVSFQGQLQLQKYPSSKERFMSYLAIIEANAVARNN